MRIIVDFQPLIHECIPASALKFIVHCHQKILQTNAKDEWIFIADKSYLDNETLKEIPAENILFKKIIANQIGWKFWYDYQLPSLIKKNKTDLLITTGGISSSTNVPQYAWMIGLKENSHSKKVKGYINLYKKRFQKTIGQSKAIFTVSEKSKQSIISKTNVDKEKIILLKAAADENVKPLSWTEKESIKTKYAAGKEFFSVAVDDLQQNLIDILKAFSQFKKRQQSNMQMVFVGNGLKNDIDFLSKLDTFKYRKDVHFYDSLSEIENQKIISASYALLYPFTDDEVGAVVLDAFKANIPVIISEKSSLHEIAGDAALYVDAENIESLANQMMVLYKDEKLRSGLITKGEQKWQEFSWKKTEKKLMDIIVQRMKD
ncbi:MAG TPA: glycosyltransferase [Puia sp.]|nr:glycosyltransferase [Puia sp.]